MTTQTWKLLICHPSQWTEGQQELVREVGKAMGRKANLFQYIEISGLYSVEICDQMGWTS